MRYASRPFLLGDDYIVFESPSPWIEHIFDSCPLVRDQARFMMDLYLKYGSESRWPWWKLNPPDMPISVRSFRLSPIDRLGGWSLVMWILLKLITRR